MTVSDLRKILSIYSDDQEIILWLPSESGDDTGIRLLKPSGHTINITDRASYNFCSLSVEDYIVPYTIENESLISILIRRLHYATRKTPIVVCCPTLEIGKYYLINENMEVFEGPFETGLETEVRARDIPYNRVRSVPIQLLDCDPMIPNATWKFITD